MKLIITPLFKKMVEYLHSNYPKEWSGVPVFRILSGDNIKEDMILKFEALYLMDLGTEVSTNWKNIDYNTPIQALYGGDDFDDMWMPNTNALVHTHHNLGLNTNFSGTDMGELYDKYDKAIFYVSLIVHNTAPWSAKIVWQKWIERSTPSIEVVRNCITGEEVIRQASYIQRDSIKVERDMVIEHIDGEVELPKHFIDRFQELNAKQISIPETNMNLYEKYFGANYSQDIPTSSWDVSKYFKKSSETNEFKAYGVLKQYLTYIMDVSSIKEGMIGYNDQYKDCTTPLDRIKFVSEFVDSIKSYYRDYFFKTPKKERLLIVYRYIRKMCIIYDELPFCKETIKQLETKIKNLENGYTPQV